MKPLLKDVVLVGLCLYMTPVVVVEWDSWNKQSPLFQFSQSTATAGELISHQLNTFTDVGREKPSTTFSFLMLILPLFNAVTRFQVELHTHVLSYVIIRIIILIMQICYAQVSKIESEARVRAASKGKANIDLYSASSWTPLTRSDMDHPVLPTNNTISVFTCKHSPGGATTHICIANTRVQLTTHLSTPRRWKAELATFADIQRTVYHEEVTRQLHVMTQARESSPVIDVRLWPANFPWPGSLCYTTNQSRGMGERRTGNSTFWEKFKGR